MIKIQTNNEIVLIKIQTNRHIISQKSKSILAKEYYAQRFAALRWWGKNKKPSFG